MSKRIFTGDQIEELSNNDGVARCSEKSITYNKQFKIRAISLYKQGFASTEIFKQAGLDPNVIGKGQPKECLKRWNRTFRKKGLEGLSEVRGKNGKGGRPKTKNLTGAEKIKRLEAEVAYLKAENHFLAKLRAKRAE